MLIIIILGDILEIGAQHAIAAGNITAFERYLVQLKSFYFDFE
jgi:26S proteasome regulatory subunit N12